MRSLDELVIHKALTKRVDQLEQLVAQLLNQQTRVRSLDEISSDLGDQRSGRFLALASGSEPTDANATGAFMSADGETFSDGIEMNVGTVKNGKPSAGFNVGGDFIAANGAITANADGMLMSGLLYPLRYRADYGGETREAWLGMRVPEGGSAPAFAVILTEPGTANLISNGDFEAGNFSGGWAASPGWVIDAVQPLAGSFSARGNANSSQTFGTNRITVGGGNLYRLDFLYKLLSPSSMTVNVTWYDAVTGGNAIKTISLAPSISTTTQQYSVVVTAPAGALSAVVLFAENKSSAGELAWVDNVSFSQVGVSRTLTFADALLEIDTDFKAARIDGAAVYDAIGRAVSVRYQKPAPAAAAVATVIAGTGLSIGAYAYRLTYVDADGKETDAGPVSNTVTTTSGNQRVSLVLPTVAPYGISTLKIYRTAANGSTYWGVGSVAIGTATFTDAKTDATLTVAMPTSNATSLQRMPRRASWLFNEMCGNQDTTLTMDTGQALAVYWLYSLDVNGSWWTQSVWLADGTYTLSILGQTHNGHAKIDILVDGVVQVSGQDWYSAAQVKNVIQTATLSIDKPGYHVIKVQINGRNSANTSGYRLRFTRMWIAPNAD